MNPADIERVFGRDRLKMKTGEHVEVFREPSLPGERRRYTKRFLSTTEGDFRHWTEREWRILARLVGHRIGPVPDVVQFDRGSDDRPALVQTYDAGITVDHWATLLPVERNGRVLRHVFEDCAHWWALAQHCLVALDAIHELHLVHLDLKADNVCIPLGPSDFDPYVADQPLRPLFGQIALIDFAFSLVSGENLVTALPIGHQADYAYQSPRLLRALEAGRQGDLQPTRELDWRCDIFSLAAMLNRYLPAPPVSGRGGWSGPRREQAQVLVYRLFDIHHGPLPAVRPHRALIALTEQALDDRELVASLERGWMLALDADMTPANSPTPVTRIAVPVPVALGPMAPYPPPYLVPRRATPRWPWLAAAVVAGALGAPLLGDAWHAWRQGDEEPVTAQSRHEVTPGVAARDAAAVPATDAVKAAVPAAAPPVVSAAASEAAAASSPVANVQVADAAPVDAASATGAEAARDAAGNVAGTAAAKAASAPAVLASSTPASPSESPAASSPAPSIAQAREPAPAPMVAKVRPAKSMPRAPALAAASPRSRSAAHAPAASRQARAATPRYAHASVAAPRPVIVAKAAAPKPAPTKAAPTINPALASAPPITPTTAPAPIPTPAPASAQATAPSSPPPSVTLASAIPPPTGSPPPVADDAPAATRLSEDFSERSFELITEHIPRIAQHAERMVLRVLHVAAQADFAGHEGDIRSAARGLRVATDDTLFEVHIAPNEARRLNDAASSAFWSEHNVRRALNLQARAFGANPLDREVAGNFAFYLLKQRPAQAELARQLALHALTISDPQLPNTRVDDWTTLAIASALAGRQRDATNALYVTLALADSLDRPCRSALAAYASHGERMRAPAEAMLYRIRAWGRSEESSFCRWPPSWSVSARAQ